MNEANFTIFQNTVEGIEFIIYACCLVVFFYPFMAGRRERNPQKVIKMLIVFLSYVAVYFINIVADLDGWLCMVIVTVLLAAVSRYLGIDRKSAFFFGVLFFSVRNLSSLTVASVNFYTGRHFVQGEEEEEVERVLWNAALNFCLVELLQLILFSAMLYIVGRQIRKCRMELHIRELCYLLLTPLTGILFGNIIFRILLVVSENRVIQLYEQYPVLIAIVPVVAALFYAGILVTIISYQKMVGFQEEKKKHFVEQQQVHAIQERMEEVEQFYEGIRRMKHEMKNHLTNIKGLFEVQSPLVLTRIFLTGYPSIPYMVYIANAVKNESILGFVQTYQGFALAPPFFKKGSLKLCCFLTAVTIITTCSIFMDKHAMTFYQTASQFT